MLYSMREQTVARVFDPGRFVVEGKLLLVGKAGSHKVEWLPALLKNYFTTLYRVSRA